MGKRSAAMRWLVRIAGGILAALTVLGAYAFWYEPASLQTVDYPVPLDGRLGRLRVAVIADLHAGSPYINTEKIDEIVRLTNAERPDVILLAGDYVIHGILGGRRMAIEEAAEHLRPLAAPLGVFAVLGNHDHWENAAKITAAFRRVGIHTLENASTNLGSETSGFTLVGIGDYMTRHHNVAKAIAGVGEAARTLCFTHTPDIFPELPAGACDLLIGGHTHGGQVWLPFVGRLVVPSRYGQHYAAGLVKERREALFVSSGVGTSILPVRFGVPPEITILDIE